jgi:hypothetical protein
VKTAYNSSKQELEELRAAALEVCLKVKEGEAQAGSLLAYAPSVGMSLSACAAPFT